MNLGWDGYHFHIAFYLSLDETITISPSLWQILLDLLMIAISDTVKFETTFSNQTLSFKFFGCASTIIVSH